MGGRRGDGCHRDFVSKVFASNFLLKISLATVPPPPHPPPTPLGCALQPVHATPNALPVHVLFRPPGHILRGLLEGGGGGKVAREILTKKWGAKTFETKSLWQPSPPPSSDNPLRMCPSTCATLVASNKTPHSVHITLVVEKGTADIKCDQAALGGLDQFLHTVLFCASEFQA